MSEIILASQSPRRKQFLTQMKVSFTAIPSDFDEQLDENRSIKEVAIELALGKAGSIAAEYPDAIVIGSDTIVGVAGRQLAKPADIAEARAMLLSLSGQRSTVTTSSVVVHTASNTVLSDADTTTVVFKKDSDEVTKLREEYLASGDWHDKAGGYGIQGGAAPLIDHIEGSYDTVVGLPTTLLAAQLESLGVTAQPVVEPAPVPQLPKS